MNQKIEHSSEPHYAWVMVTIGFVIVGMEFGALVTISVFLKPLVQELNWSRGDTSFAYTVGAIASGVGGIVMGWMADRFSTRPVVLFGGVLMGQIRGAAGIVGCNNPKHRCSQRCSRHSRR